MKYYTKKGYLFFFLQGVGPEEEIKRKALRDFLRAYGKVIEMGAMLALRPKEEYKDQEIKLLQHILEEFNFLVSEYLSKGKEAEEFAKILSFCDGGS